MARQAARIVAPAHLPDDVRAVWVEMTADWEDPAAPDPSLEAYCGQVARLRDAQRRLASEGSVISDPRGHPIPHPALAIERAAQDEIRRWGDRFLS